MNNIQNQTIDSNIQFQQYYSLQNNLQTPLSGLIKNTLQLIDVINVETKYIASKFPNSHEVIDLEARNVFSKGIILLFIIKCSYGYNQYVTREKMINNGITVNDCTRYRRREDWAYVTQCQSLTKTNVNFLIELQDKLLQKKYLIVTKSEIEDIIRDIRKFLINNNDFVTN